MWISEQFTELELLDVGFLSSVELWSADGWWWSELKSSSRKARWRSWNVGIWEHFEMTRRHVNMSFWTSRIFGKLNHVSGLMIDCDCKRLPRLSNKPMPCYCSNCFPSRNLVRRTIQKHLQDDKTALIACARHDHIRSAHLRGCIQRNIQFLATSITQATQSSYP